MPFTVAHKKNAHAAGGARRAGRPWLGGPAAAMMLGFDKGGVCSQPSTRSCCAAAMMRLLGRRGCASGTQLLRPSDAQEDDKVEEIRPARCRARLHPPRSGDA